MGETKCLTCTDTLTRAAEDGTNGKNGQGVFKSTAFMRTNQIPERPTGGSYTSPLPATSGWSDGIPDGEAKLWASTRIFSSDGASPQEALWGTPKQLTDTSGFEARYSSVAENPGTPSSAVANWTETGGDGTIWLAVRTSENGEWTDWSVSRIKGERGYAGRSSFKSTVFRRMNPRPTIPMGGSYESPVPTSIPVWSDGIPDGEMKLWASTRIFSSDGGYPQEASWSAVRQLTDTGSIETRFSAVELNPGTPTDNTSNWTETGGEGTIWMAVRTCKNGYWSAWEVTKIKGEKGDAGTGISLKGSVESTAQLPASGNTTGDCYTVGGELYFWDGDSWEDVGRIKGEQGEQGNPGKDGAKAYLHIKFSDDGGESFTANDGETPGKYIGVRADYDAGDSQTESDYQWIRFRGDDGYGYEYIYRRTTDATAPSTPVETNLSDGYVPDGWTGDPTGTDSGSPYEWMAYRKKTDGVWGDYRGSATDATKAVLWSSYGKDGAEGTGGEEIYRLCANGVTPDIPTGETPEGWSRVPLSLNQSTPCLWWSRRTKTLGIWGAWSSPALKGQLANDGKDGHQGLLPYPQGLYESGQTYTSTDYTTPMVLDGANYYVLKAANTSSTGVRPSEDYATGGSGTKWELLEKYKAIYVELLMAELGKIGSAVFWGEFMYSEQGTGTFGAPTEAGGTFTPNLLLDFAKGIIRSLKSEFETAEIKKSVLTDVEINGTIRQPWSRGAKYVILGNDSADRVSYDNMVVTGGWDANTVGTPLTWKLKDNGRIVRLAHWMYDGTDFGGEVTITAQDGKYFYEDGIRKSTLRFHREIVELIGYGDTTTFYGWVVLSRTEVMASRKHGQRSRKLAWGYVTGTDSAATTEMGKYGTFDGSTITVTRTGSGEYKLTLPSSWGLTEGGYMVTLTGYGRSYNENSAIKATLMRMTATSVTVHTSDDASRNDGSFLFEISNMEE